MSHSAVKLPSKSGPSGLRLPQGMDTRLSAKSTRMGLLVLGVLIIGFVLLQCFLPLRTTVKIGADEDFELSKVTLCMKGYKLYTQIWDDQPPLVTCLITQILRHISPSILGPRLFTIVFAILLLAATFIVMRRASGLLAASLATALLIASPGFLELSCSCMQEILALGPTVAALALLLAGSKSRWHLTEILGGVLYGFALQMKLIGLMYLPVAALILWLRYRDEASPLRTLVHAVTLFGACLLISFVGLNHLTGNSLWVQLQQAWAAHFASTQSFEYGSPNDRPFDWSTLPKNWDTTAPALLGLVLLVRQARQHPAAVLPVAWLALTFIIFPTHKPWWSYYYVHNALPLCWCAGVGLAWLWGQVRARVNRGGLALLGLYALCAASWMGARVYLQAAGIRNSPQLYSCLVLKEIERYKPFTTFLFAEEPIYSFHAQIPMPPRLAVISLKRLWAGHLNNAQIVAELERVQPGLILRGNDGREVPYQELLNREYRRVYRDGTCQLYAHVSIARKPQF